MEDSSRMFWPALTHFKGDTPCDARYRKKPTLQAFDPKATGESLVKEYVCTSLDISLALLKESQSFDLLDYSASMMSSA